MPAFRSAALIAFVSVAFLALPALLGCGDDGRTPECVPSAAEICMCPDGRLGAKVCLADETWGDCVCRDDGGTDSGMDATPDSATPDSALPDAPPDTPLPDAGVTWPPLPDAYTPGMVSRITSLTIPIPATSGLSDCCRDFGAISKDNVEFGTDEIDNAFAQLAAATTGLGLDLQAVLDSAIAGERLNVLLDHQGFEGDPDSAFVIAALDGVPDTMGGFLIDRGSFVSGTGTPRSLFDPATLSAGSLAAGPGAMTLALPFAGVTLAYTFEDVQIEATVTVGAGVTYAAGMLSGYLKVDDYFGGINDFVSTSCACLGLTGPLYSRTATTWTEQCMDVAIVDANCPAAADAGCREVASGTDCTASPIIIPSLADLDTDSGQPGYESLSLGLRFTAVPVTVSGVTP